MTHFTSLFSNLKIITNIQKVIFFSIIILITHTCKTKNITITRYYFIFPVPEKKENSKLKQSEIGVKMIIKMKNRQIVFMNNTKKQPLFDLYEILIVKSLKEVHHIF